MTDKRNKTPADRKSASASAKSKSVLVFASADSGLITAPDSMKQILSAELASFGCKACGTKLTASADSKPFCVKCGSEEVSPTSEPIGQEIKSLTDEDVAAIQCSSCNVTNVVTASAVHAGGHIHCSCCSTRLDLIANADEMPLNDMDADEDDLALNAELDDLSDLNSADPLFDATDADDDLTLEPDDIQADGDILEDLGDDAPDLSDDAMDLDGSDEGLPADLMEADEGLADPDTEIASEEDIPEVVVDEPTDGEALMDSLEMADDDAGFSTAYVAGRLVAMRGHVAVASLTKAGAGKSADLIATSGFQNAVAHSVKSLGLRKGLRAMAFKPILVPTLSKASVSRQVASVQQKASNEVVQKIATFNDSLALAAAGLSRGKWRGYENPLRAAFETELARAGVRNPARVSAAIFSKSAVPFTKSLVEVASKLTKMSADARRELADVLDMTQDAPNEVLVDEDNPAFSEDELQDTPISLESRLNTTAALLRPARTPISASAAVTEAARSMLNGTAPLNFNV